MIRWRRAVGTTCLSVVEPVEDLAGFDGMERFGSAVWGLGLGMSNKGTLGVGGLEFDDASPQFPVASAILRVDSLYSLPSVCRVDDTIRRGTGKTSIGCGNSSGVDELPGLSYSPSSLVEC